MTNANAAKLGRLGGNATKAKKLKEDPDYYRKISKLAAIARQKCKDINIERRCPKNGLMYRPGGLCPCFRV